MKSYPISSRDFDLMDRLKKRRAICAGAFGLGIGMAIGTYGASLIVSAVAACYFWRAKQGTDGLFAAIRARTDPLDN